MAPMAKGAPGEVPETFWYPADPSKFNPRPQAQPNGPYEQVIIHITSGRENPYWTAEMFADPETAKSSAHFIVGRHPLIILQCVPLCFAAIHAHRANGRSVGIEHCAREPNEPSFPKGDPGLFPTREQYYKSARLSAYLLKAAGLPVIKGITIEGHKKADPQTTHDLCPDGVWDWDFYMPLVIAEYNNLPRIDPIT